jgi:predicted RNA-binding Zn-ribbon protein involved in translation (DUF1610 family)
MSKTTEMKNCPLCGEEILYLGQHLRAKNHGN